MALIVIALTLLVRWKLDRDWPSLPGTKLLNDAIAMDRQVRFRFAEIAR